MPMPLYPHIEDGSLVKANVWISDKLTSVTGIVLDSAYFPEGRSRFYSVLIEWGTHNTTRAFVQDWDIKEYASAV